MKVSEEMYLKRSARLREILEERDIPQRTFTVYNEDIPADIEPFSESYISQLVNGRKHLTENMADRIISIGMPDIRLEYLLCYDDYKTESDKMLAEGVQNNYYQDQEFHALKVLLEMKGYFLSKGCVFTPDDNWTEDEIRKAIRDHSIYTIHKGTNLIASLDQKQFDRLVTDSQTLITVLIDRL